MTTSLNIKKHALQNVCYYTKQKMELEHPAAVNLPLLFYGIASLPLLIKDNITSLLT